MKSAVHPKYYSDAKVTCACGNEFTTGSTKPEIRVEICAACHPFFTGQMKYVDTMGRVERFEKLRQKAAKSGYTKKAKNQNQPQKEERPQTLREMIEQQKKAK